jgi:hypothetical protein
MTPNCFFEEKFSNFLNFHQIFLNTSNATLIFKKFLFHKKLQALSFEENVFRGIESQSKKILSIRNGILYFKKDLCEDSHTVLFFEAIRYLQICKC